MSGSAPITRRAAFGGLLGLIGLASVAAPQTAEARGRGGRRGGSHSGGGRRGGNSGGCGSRGGPGYRKPNGKCASW